jgi:hypothetical protein
MTGPSQDPSDQVPYASWKDLLDRHGPIVLIGYYASRLIELATPTPLLARLARAPGLKTTAVDGDGRARPWWQDLVLVLLAVVIAMVTFLASPPRPTAPLVACVALYLLLDIVSYHARVLWFDDLQPGRAWRQLAVLSHRRLFFQAVINFVETVFLFAVLYRLDDPMRAPGDLYQASLTIALTFARPEHFEALSPCVVTIQIAVSVFFLVTVISIVSAKGYAREELAHNPPSSSPPHQH